MKTIGAGTLSGSHLAVFVFAFLRLKKREYLPVIDEGDPPPTEEHYEEAKRINMLDKADRRPA